jgi:hypothetical protein
MVWEQRVRVVFVMTNLVESGQVSMEQDMQLLPTATL